MLERVTCALDAGSAKLYNDIMNTYHIFPSSHSWMVNSGKAGKWLWEFLARGGGAFDTVYGTKGAPGDSGLWLVYVWCAIGDGRQRDEPCKASRSRASSSKLAAARIRITSFRSWRSAPAKRSGQQGYPHKQEGRPAHWTENGARPFRASKKGVRSEIGADRTRKSGREKTEVCPTPLP